MDVLKNLHLDKWYKVVVALSAAALIAALTIPLQIPNGQVAKVALGAFLFGIAEWMQHPLVTRIAPGMKITGYPRRASVSGTVTDILGLALIAWGTVQLLHA